MESVAETPLDRSTLFRALDPADRAQLTAHAHQRRYEAGRPIFHMGDAGDSMIAVLAGTVRVTLPAPNGKDVILADLPAGELFGEVALLDGGGRSAEARALTNVELLVLDRSDVLAFLASRPEACLKILARVCGLLRSSDERMSDVAFADVRTRLGKVLLRQVGRHRDRRGPAKIALSQTDLARMIVGSREAVNKQLAIWQRAGVVELRDGWIFVLKPTELIELADH